MRPPTGASAYRGRRSSRLLFGWHAKYGTLDAHTGQVGLLTTENLGTIGSVEGRNGASASVVAAHAVPRFVQRASEGYVTRLALEGSIAGQDRERLEYSWPQKVFGLSIYVRVYPMYAPGANLVDLEYLLMLGNRGGAGTGGGYFGLYRTGTTWQVRRERNAVAIVSLFTEPAAAVFPIDLLATMTDSGTVQLFSRDAAVPSVLRSGSAVTDPNMAIGSEQWADNKLVLATAGVNGFIGGRWRLEEVKIARGVHTFSSIDALS